MSTADVSGEDFFLTFTGFDEIAVAKAFGTEISDLREKPFMFLRSLAFVHQRRTQGLNDADAFQAAMELSISALGDYFPDSEPELDPEAPEGAQGKGDSPVA